MTEIYNVRCPTCGAMFPIKVAPNPKDKILPKSQGLGLNDVTSSTNLVNQQTKQKAIRSWLQEQETRPIGQSEGYSNLAHEKRGIGCTDSKAAEEQRQAGFL